MPTRTVKTGITHGYSGYANHDCGCDVCRAAFRQYQRDYRARRRQRDQQEQQTMEEIKQPPAEPTASENKTKPTAPAKKQAPAKKAPRRRVTETPTLLGVRKDLTERNVYASAPGVAALAERLAVIVDNPLALPQAPAAAARLLDIYKEVGIAIKPRGGKLATVKSMMADPPDEEQQAS